MPHAWIDPLEPRVLCAGDSIRLFSRAFDLEIPERELLGVAATADFNGDGFADLVLGRGGFVVVRAGERPVFRGGLQVFLNDGAGHFTGGPVQALPGPPDSIVTGDFNGDGRVDVAANRGAIWLLAGDGQGGFSSSAEYAGNQYSPGADQSLVTGDFNGDGRTDLAASGWRVLAVNPKDGTMLGESQIAVLFGGAAGLSRPVLTHIAGQYPLRLAAVRYDGDGRTDLAVGGSIVQILRSKGDGTFDFPASIGSGPVSHFMSRDVNGDGRLDVLWQAQPSNVLQYALADGSTASGFGAVRTLDPGTSVSLAADGFGAGDFNGDGLLDLIVAPDFDSGRGAFFQRSDGTFRPIVVDGGAYFGVVADFNGDGLDDVFADRILYLANPPSVYTRANGTLVITGTRRSDRLTVTSDGGRLTTVLNGVTYSSRLSKVNQIQINTGLGRDRVTIDASVFVRSMISAGGDDDTVQGGSGNDTLQGDNGDDVLAGGAGVDVIQGGKGNDVLTGGAGTDSVYGNRGKDLFADSDDLDELLDRAPGEGRFTP